MKNRTLTILAFLFILQAKTQNEKFQINGAARSYLFSNELQIDNSLDSITPRKSNYGHNLLDLGISVFPNTQTEVIGIFRIRNELGGFWGGGVTFNVRQLTLKGVANNVVRYEIGDIDLKMTPYTLFNTTEEGVINESDIFKVRRQVFHYDLFYQKNQWRMQGAKIDFNVLTNSIIKKANVKGYLTRQRATDGLNQPERLFGGGSLNLICNSKFNFKINNSNLFDVSKTLGNDSTKFINSVFTSMFNYKMMNQKKIVIEMLGEGGFSNSNYIHYTNLNAPESLNDWFYDIASSTHFKERKILFKLGVKDVGKDFRSPGAQTKRINYAMAPNLFPLVDNSSINREIIASDIVSDITFFRSASFYNRNIDYSLDAFNPIFGVSKPYGISTPNRQGISSMIEYSDSSNIFYIQGKASFLNDLTGEGVLEKRKYFTYSLSSNIFINKLLDYEKIILINGGFNYSNAKRNHSPDIFVQNVDFNNSILDLGLELEIIKNLHLLYGYKSINAQGLDYLSVRDDNFTISSFHKIEINMNQNISSIGLKYDFTKKSSLILNYQNIRCNYEKSELSFIINQFFILAQIKF